MVDISARAFRCLAAIVLVLSAARSARADAWPVKRGPSREPAPHAYDRLQWKKLPREFLEDVPACTLYSGLSYLIEPDGTIEKITHEITRFNGRKGIDRLGEYRNITYDPAYETLTLNEARVYKGDGTILPIEAKHVHIRDVGTDYLIIEHDKQLVISFPNLEVGDAIEVKWTTRGRNPEHQGRFFTRYNFGDDKYPVAADELRVRVPRAQTLKYAASGGQVDPVIRDEGDFRLYQWRVTNRPPLPQDENLPSRDEMHLSVACSTFASWEEVGVWKKAIRKDCWTCTPEIRRVVADLTRGLAKPIDKARALTYWVRRHIRYVSIGEKHDYTPHPPVQVLTNRFGDCKDQTQLLAVMLREAGIPAALASLGVADDGQVIDMVPSPWATHAILLVTLDDQDHWIDTTTSLAGWDYLPKDDRDRVCYVVDDKGLRLLRTPKLTPAENLTVRRTLVTVAANGSSRCDRQAEYTGSAALSQRGEWVDVPAGERRRGMANTLQNSQSRARLLRLEIDEKKLTDFDQPVSARVVFEVPSHFSGENMLEGSFTDSKVWSRLLANNLDYDRKMPFDLGSPFEVVQTYDLRLSNALVLKSLPDEKEIRSRWGVFSLKVRGSGTPTRKVELEFRLRMDVTRIEPADFAEFRKFHEAVYKNYRTYVELYPTDSVADAAALDAMLHWAPEDTALALTLARIYRDNNRPSDARRVLLRTLTYRPKKMPLWELLVALPGTAEEVESAYGELIRRAPKQQPRYVLELATRRIDRGDFDGARQLVAPLLKQDSKEQRGQANYLLARCDFKQEKFREAVEHLNAADSPPQPESAALLKAQAYEKLKQPKEAIEAYEKVLMFDGKETEALEALVRLELASGRRHQALKHLRRYAIAVQHSSAGLVKVAEQYRKLDRLDDAFELAEQARSRRLLPDVQRILGLIELQRGHAKEALAHLEQARFDAEVLEASIEANLMLGRLTDAIHLGERAATVQPATPGLQRTLHRLLALAERCLALQKFKPAQANPDSYREAVCDLVCAEHALAVGRSAEVQRLLTRSFAAGVGLAPACSLRGQLALERGLHSKALADAERALTIDPREPRAFYVRGRVRLERGVDGALADLSRSAELSQRKDAFVLHWLATALFRAGARAEAIAAQREAAALRPDDSDIKDQLAAFEASK